MYTAEETSGSLETGNMNLNTPHATTGPSSYEAPVIGHNHPLYHHPNDTPGSSLISLQLTGSENYAVCNAVVLSWIRNAVTPGLLSSIVYAGDAHKVWSDLKERFDKINGAHVFQLHKEIHSLTQGTMTVTEYYTQLRGLWNEFNSIMPYPWCSYAESKRFQEHFEYQRLLEFLMGLNESYSAARGQILMQSPIPNLNKAYSLIVDHESQRNLTSTGRENVVFRVVESTALFSKKGGGAPIHSDSFGQHPGGDDNSKRGHYDNQYKPSKFQNQKLPLVCEVEVTSSQSNIDAPTTFFTQDQYHQILQLLAKGGENRGDHSAKAATAGSSLSALDLFSGQVKGIGKEDQGLYILKEGDLKAAVKHVVPVVSTRSNATSVCSSASATLWHLRLGHVPVDVIKKSSTIEVLDNEHPACTVLTHNGKKYFVTVVDDYSRFTWVFLIASKADAIIVLKDFFTQVHNLYSTTVKTLRTDNGSEFFSAAFQAMLSILGIRHQSTCVYTPQQNGVAERKHRTILEMARALRFQSSVLLKFWGECLTTAVYLLNRVPSKLLQYKTPFELLHSHPPSLAHIRVFGCLCYASCPYIPDKFSPRAIPAVLMGYSSS
ncbi:uncharacterized protein LOC129900060 [Solanum dulcamara]|uniref:uncharacterized protein LOC129900060 n=1 Tax=Solanum dulcamara TaxID=45834 RepID=UPI0024856664|nr:uncharacterized protein LOC129900060 [Solanum dulcamara]